MARGGPKFNPRKARRNIKRPRPVSARYIGRMSGAQQNRRGRILAALKFGRTLMTGFPLPAVKDIYEAIYQVYLSYIQLIGKQASYVGCICSFEITPGSLLKESPLLAQISQDVFSFPAIPVKVRHLRIRVTNTTTMGNRRGKWAVVYIPYREMHDSGKYSKTVQTLSYAELCQMPYARSGNCSQDLVVDFRARDRSDYCARARELSEPIGILTVIWENYDRTESDYAKPFDNTDFSCEFEISGTIDPLVVFGPTHRSSYARTVFEPTPVTERKKILTIFNDGRRFYGNQSELAAYLETLMEPGE